VVTLSGLRFFSGRRPISKKITKGEVKRAGSRREKIVLIYVGTVFRLLWRAAGSKANDPELAERPNRSSGYMK